MAERHVLGCDLGSRAVKLVLVDEARRLVDSVYEPNTGIQESLVRAAARMRPLPVAAVGVTGSGRHLAEVLLGADTVMTEIAAHARGALHRHPAVATVFEIGGEDCKLIVLRDGVIDRFAMNTLCGSGTGSMIEAIAVRLGVPVEGFGELALRSRQEVTISGKCGIFAQSSVVTRLNQGYQKSDIAMGVARALVDSYFAMLVKGLRLRGPFVFQGATAFNGALRRCFEEKLGEPVVVPEQPHLQGALGIALLAQERVPQRTAFRGWDRLGAADVTIATERLEGCSNRCEALRIEDGGSGAVRRVGSRCDRCTAEGTEP
jgi:predicted CoA-substrate-specific enzyme activase